MEKICIKNVGVQHSLEKKKLQMFFLKKPSLVKGLSKQRLGDYHNAIILSSAKLKEIVVKLGFNRL